MRLILLCILFTFFLNSHTQEKTVMPYRLLGGKILIDISIDNIPYTFILDTGAHTSVTAEAGNDMGLKVTDSITVKDVTSVKGKYYRASLNSIGFSNNKLIVRNVKAILLDVNNTSLNCYEAKGIIGNDILRHFVMEIDSRTKEIVLSPAGTSVPVSMRNMLKFKDNKDKMPVLELGLGCGKTLDVLFDTGTSRMLEIRNVDFDALNASDCISCVGRGKGYSNAGISQVVKAMDLQRIQIPLFTVGMAKFEHLICLTGTPPYSLLGTKILEYGKVTVDYPNSRFYFEPFSPNPFNLKVPLWNINMTVTEDCLKIAELWNEMTEKLNVGDTVLAIDGEKIGKLDFCETIINGLPQLKDKNQASLTVKNGDKEETIIITKEQEYD